MGMLKNKFLQIALLAGMIFSFSYCTKHNQVLDLQSTATFPNGTLLTSISGSPKVLGLGEGTWDGTIESVWANAPKLTVTATVPDLGNNTFPGFVGNSTNVTLRSCYDAQNIYFLVEWDCDKNMNSAWWYFDPATSLWKQETAAPTFDANGIITRNGFVQDQFAFIWNINNSCADFASQSCYATCHANTPSMTVDPKTGNIITTPVYSGSMRTSAPNEKLDVWRCRMITATNYNQINDYYMDWNNGTANSNGFHKDDQGSPLANQFGGGTSNKQSLKMNNAAKTKVSVPIWFIPGKSYYNAILASDTTGNAKFIIALDSNGVLHYANTRGGAEAGTIDPNSGTDYQRNGAGDGQFCIPGSVFGPFVGGMADISANAYYTGKGWRLLIKRALKTSDVLEQDVDFSSLKDQDFGIGSFFNTADNQHAITAYLKLTFKK